MKTDRAGKIKKSEDNFRVERPTQTGFSSPATHYNEPRIDLNEVLVANADATFYIRVSDDTFNEFNIMTNDVLIIDKSRTAKKNSLAVVILDGQFQIVRIGQQFNNEVELWGIITYVIKSVL